MTKLTVSQREILSQLLKKKLSVAAERALVVVS